MLRVLRSLRHIFPVPTVARHLAYFPCWVPLWQKERLAAVTRLDKVAILAEALPYLQRFHGEPAQPSFTHNSAAPCQAALNDAGPRRNVMCPGILLLRTREFGFAGRAAAGKTVVIKYGGAAMKDPTLKARSTAAPPPSISPPMTGLLLLAVITTPSLYPADPGAHLFFQEGVIRDLVLLSTVGIRPVLVHGGGPEINGWCVHPVLPSPTPRCPRIASQQTAGALAAFYVFLQGDEIAL